MGCGVGTHTNDSVSGRPQADVGRHLEHNLRQQAGGERWGRGRDIDTWGMTSVAELLRQRTVEYSTSFSLPEQRPEDRLVYLLYLVPGIL